jgi:hypothetical protein
MKCIVCILSLFWLQHLPGAFAQEVVHVVQEANNLSWFQSSNGLLFYDKPDGFPGFQAPVGSGIHAIFSQALWVSGLNSEGNIRVAAPRYCYETTFCEYSPGPLTTDGSLETSQTAFSDYNRFWVVNRAMVETHHAYFDCLYDLGCDVTETFPGGYDVPSEFTTWPAHGDVSSGFAENLAPFFDRNENGIYEPFLGDCPSFCGDAASYLINNDVGADHTDSHGLPLGIEVHTTVYSFEADSGALGNTLFVRHKVINRSNEIYQDTYIGTFTDIQMGYFADNWTGTDVQRSMIFSFNGDDFDEASSFLPGYEDDLAAVGIKYLDGPFKDGNQEDDPMLSNDFDTYGNQGSGWDDGIIDNERLALAHSMSYINYVQGLPQEFEFPIIPIQTHRALSGIWRGGTQLTYGGNGLNYDSNTTTRYMYTGTSDPLLFATGGVEPEEGNWTEETAARPPGDRRMIASSGPFTFEPGDIQYLDYAVIFARDSQNPNEEVLATLQRYADDINGLHCSILEDNVLSTRYKSDQTLDFKIYPNPASGHFTLETHMSHPGHYTISDITGRVAGKGAIQGVNTEISTLELGPGVYVLRIESNGSTGVKRLVVY